MSRLVIFVETSQTLPAILFFTAIAYKQNRIVAINETQTLILCLQVERARSKMLCAVDYIFNLLCAFNCLQPMKKFAFSVASRATGRLQIKPSGSGDENVVGRKRIHTTVRKEVNLHTSHHGLGGYSKLINGLKVAACGAFQRHPTRI